MKYKFIIGQKIITAFTGAVLIATKSFTSTRSIMESKKNLLFQFYIEFAEWLRYLELPGSSVPSESWSVNGKW